MTDSNWIKISDRKPEYPAWLFYPGTESATLVREPLPHELLVGYSHWQPAQIPDSPPRELTQREKDREAVEKWARENPGSSVREIWYAALKREREELPDALNAALNQWWREDYDDHRDSDTVIRDFFRARREGGKAK